MKGFIMARPRHTYRTFYNGNVVLCGVDQGFFQPDVCVTFFRWDKTGGDLNAVHTKIKDMLYILVRGDAAGATTGISVPNFAA